MKNKNVEIVEMCIFQSHPVEFISESVTTDGNPSTYCPKLSPIQRKITHQKWMKNNRFCVLSKYAKL
jgi:hypothetical protein